MALTLNGTGYEAEGPYTSTSNLKEQSGVYIITGTNNPADPHTVIDVGEAGNVKDRISNHDRSDCWNRQSFKNLHASVIYCTERERMAIESQLRNFFKPACGIR